ncbi:hypothetical protein [Microbacterium sp. CIAB417]|uniref:hypothetical protein n=1 Tax=Microbacterium sp. CIAB417 TaxID=2860287 RepID=UPI001FAC590F|nr:hypothetical protein [Microbacterium sp. CIAB417]
MHEAQEHASRGRHLVRGALAAVVIGVVIAVALTALLQDAVTGVVIGVAVAVLVAVSVWVSARRGRAGTTHTAPHLPSGAPGADLRNGGTF